MEVTLKKDQKLLSDEEKVSFSKELDQGFFKLVTQTTKSDLFRCIFCRTSVVRKINETGTLIRSKAHTKNCKLRKLRNAWLKLS
jgi:hypothetical protein